MRQKTKFQVSASYELVSRNCMNITFIPEGRVLLRNSDIVSRNYVLERGSLIIPT